MKNDLLFFDIQLHDSRIDLVNAVESNSQTLSNAKNVNFKNYGHRKIC